jgi:hypothetical protein
MGARWFAFDFERQTMFRDLAAQHPLLSMSSVLGLILSLKKLCSGFKSAMVSGSRGLVELNGALCDLAVKCHAKWFEAKAELSSHREKLAKKTRFPAPN